MTRYAENTTVPIERSQAELVRLLKKHGASRHGFISDEDKAAVAFVLDGKQVRLELSWPSPESIYKKAQESPPRGWHGWTEPQRCKWADQQADQLAMQRWRAIVLVTKAKLEMVAEGMSTIEREFMADLVMSNGQRVEQWLAPQLVKMFAGGKMPPLLGDGK
jgi:hypothetical protein